MWNTRGRGRGGYPSHPEAAEGCARMLTHAWKSTGKPSVQTGIPKYPCSHKQSPKSRAEPLPRPGCVQGQGPQRMEGSLANLLVPVCCHHQQVLGTKPAVLELCPAPAASRALPAARAGIPHSCREQGGNEQADGSKGNPCSQQFHSCSDFDLESCQVSREASHTQQLLPSYDRLSPQTSSTNTEQILLASWGFLRPPQPRESWSSVLASSSVCPAQLCSERGEKQGCALCKHGSAG